MFDLNAQTSHACSRGRVMARFVGSAGVLALAMHGANAQSERSVSAVQVEIGGWHFVPTLLNAQVETILAFRIGAPVGENLTAVWYQVGPDGEWESSSWTTQEHTKILASVKAELGLSNQYDALWPVAEGNDVAAPSQSLVSGVLASDPLAQELRQLPASTVAILLEALEAAGWPAACTAPDLGVPGGEVLDVQLLASCINANLIDDETPAGALYSALHAGVLVPPGGPQRACVRTVSYGAWSAATWSVNWTTGAPTLTSTADGACIIQNHYTAVGIATECRNMTVVCRDCSVSSRLQCHVWQISWSLAQNEVAPAIVVPCTIPPGYVPPATPTNPAVPPANFDGPFNEGGPMPSSAAVCP